MDTEEYFYLLDKHDWYYDFSDDSRVWKMGKADEKLLKRLYVDNTNFEKMYNDFHSHYFSGQAFGTKKVAKPKLSNYK